MISNLLKYVFFCSLWIPMPCIAAINVRSFHITAEQGLGSNYVRSIVQDSKGYIWMGSTNGLIRYDGYAPKLITPSNQENRRLMLDERVQTVQMWHNRFVFLRLRGAKYSCYDTQTDRFVDYTGNGTYEEKYPNYYLLSNGELWLTNASGAGKVIRYDSVEGFHSRSIRKGEALPQEAIRTLPKKYQYLLTDGRELHEDNRGHLIVTSEEGELWYINPKTQQLTLLTGLFSKDLVKLSGNPRYSIVTDRDGIIWVSTFGNGLFAYNPQTGEMTHFLKKGTSVSPIQTNFLLGIYEDRAGNIWVCQENMGVACISKLPFAMDIHYITSADNVDHSNSIHLLTRLEDQIWLGNRYNMLQQADGLLQHRKTLGTFEDDVVALCKDRQGTVWAGTRQSGVWAGNRNYRHHDGDENSLAKGKISDIICDRQGRVWISVFDGGVDLAVPDGKGGYNFRHFFRGKHHIVQPRQMLIDHTGRLWLSSNEGLIFFDPERLIKDEQAYQRLMIDSKSSAAQEVHCIYEDRTHCILAGTTGSGLAEIDNRDSRHPRLLRFYTTTDGLPDNNVQQIIQDNSGVIWVGTDRGLAVYNHKMHRFMFTTPANTPQGNMFTEHAACMLDNGWLALGTRHGIITIDPQSIKGRKPYFSPRITDMEVNGIPFFEAVEGQETESLESEKTIKLNHDQNSLTFFFSDFEYTEGIKTRYTYRLAGYDKDWSPLTIYNFAVYRNLSPGTYTIEVKALNSDGEWSETTAQRTIVIRPPFWTTWWAYLIYACLLAAILYYYYRQFRHTQQLRMSIQVEKQLTEYKLRFFTNISHEFRTPLTIIRGSMDHIQSMDSIPGNLKQPLSSMSKSVDRMTRLINQLLEFRKMQNNKLQLALEETDVIAFVRNIYQTFSQMAENKHISYTFLPFAHQYMMYIDRSFIDKIIYNLLSNAFKYTPNKGSISCKISLDESLSQIRFVIADTGIGIPEDKRAELFTRFNQSTMAHDSIGIGLHLTYELVNTHHGMIEYQPNQGGGSIFTITLPIDKSVYQERDFIKEDSLLIQEEEPTEPTILKGYKEVAEKPMNDRLVLIVDDDDDVREYLKGELQRYFVCTTATDGNDALEKIAEQKPDLMISDVMMPVMDGFELVNRIRQDKQWADIPVILLTALTDEEKQLKGINSGADDYLEKPFSTSMLLAKCRQLLAQRDRLRIQYSHESDAKPQVAEVIVNAQDKRFKDTFMIWIDNHYMEPGIDVDTFAESMGYGRTTFYKKAKAIIGQTPNDYIKSLRMKKAAELLIDDTLTISQISYKIGIEDPYYFSKSFKNYYGISPTQYRKGMPPTKNGG